MLKLWKKHQKFLKGDAGFSLVELIIVIAIMAALIAILAPQYIKYVERSRESADKTQLDEVMSATKVALADPDSTAPTIASGDTLTVEIKVDGDGKAKVSCSNDDVEASILNALGELTFKCKSAAAKGDTWVISIKEDYSTSWTNYPNFSS